jgi:hypothetical protein
MHTGRGNHYYLGDRNRIAIYQSEADPYTSRQDITGMGRFLMLRVERPDEEIYLRIAATKTFMGRGHTAWSPGSRILGETDVPLAFPGNGASWARRTCRSPFPATARSTASSGRSAP